ncbi:Hypothetical predicted protein [Pelobates cultripes]|uniref:Uncharacterized protein n=1 Tax=Pelobates cultripes TaxID=61616 RepID=A0AAD1VSB5_PELCU|nr:Hypothetical predicted protein [Pelobates cultripes]
MKRSHGAVAWTRHGLKATNYNTEDLKWHLLKPSAPPISSTKGIKFINGRIKMVVVPAHQRLHQRLAPNTETLQVHPGDISLSEKRLAAMLQELCFSRKADFKSAVDDIRNNKVPYRKISDLVRRISYKS